MMFSLFSLTAAGLAFCGQALGALTISQLVINVQGFTQKTRDLGRIVSEIQSSPLFPLDPLLIPVYRGKYVVCIYLSELERAYRQPARALPRSSLTSGLLIRNSSTTIISFRPRSRAPTE